MHGRVRICTQERGGGGGYLQHKLVHAYRHRADHYGLELLVMLHIFRRSDVDHLPLEVYAQRKYRAAIKMAAIMNFLGCKRTFLQRGEALKGNFKLERSGPLSRVVQHLHVGDVYAAHLARGGDACDQGARKRRQQPLL